MRSLLIKIALLIASVTLTIGLAELGLRLAHYGEASRARLDKFTEYDPVLGWRHRPNSSGELSTNEYRTTLQYNSNGLRGLNRTYTKPQGVLRIVVLGASFVDGYTVQVQDRLTEVLEASLGPKFEVINLGVPGYSTDQELLLLEREGWKYQPDLVVLAFSYRDVWANGSRYSADTMVGKPLFIIDGAGNLSLSNVPVPYPERTLRDRFRVYDLIRTAIRSNRRLFSWALKTEVARGKRPDDGEFKVYQGNETEELKREWNIARALLRKMKQETEQRRVGLLIFYVPSRSELFSDEWNNAHLPPDYDRGEVARKLVGICRAEGIAYIEPSDQFKAAAKQVPLYYHRDPHWNVAGHHLAGEILAEYVRSNWQTTLQ